jgi:hypothetical protein
VNVFAATTIAGRAERERKMSESKPKTWEVTVPIAGHAYVEVEAETEEEAIEKAINNIQIDDIQEWTALEQFNQGNVCYCPQPWDAEATEIVASTDALKQAQQRGGS